MAAAMEEAGSIDADAVRAVLDDPDFRFNFFGFESGLGGLETYGIRGKADMFNTVSVIENGQAVTKKVIQMRIP